MEKIISYIGSKVKLYGFLKETIIDNLESTKKYNFFDIFAGTNSVSRFIKENTDYNIIANDLSKYSVILFSYLYFDKISSESKLKLEKKLEELNSLPLIKGDIYNELSVGGSPKSIEEDKKEEMFSNQPFNSRMFFSGIVGKKIDTVKKGIKKSYEDGELSLQESHILLIFLIYYADKNANTTSVYGAYLKTEKKLEKEFNFYDNDLVKIFKETKEDKNSNNELYSFNEDALSVLDIINVDEKFQDKDKNVIYLDPPYSTRSYESNYHILEYIVDFNFSYKQLKINSKTAQSVGKGKNPFTSKAGTREIFPKIIEKSLSISNNIFISYNNDKSSLLRQEEIEEMIQNYNSNNNTNVILTTYLKEYKRFKSANADTKKLQQAINQTQDKKQKQKLQLELQELQNDKKNNEKDTNTINEIIWHIRKK
jgi:adenine-specific DNA-methyltransferase